MDNLLDELELLKRDYQRHLDDKKLLQQRLKAFGEKAIPKIIENGWSKPKEDRYFHTPWDGLMGGDFGHMNFDVTNKYLTTTPVDDWKKTLQINFEIVEARALIFDKNSISRQLFSEQGTRGQKGFGNSWFGNNTAENTYNHYFSKKMGKQGKGFLLLSKPLDLTKKYGPLNGNNTIILDDERHYAEGVAVCFSPKSDKIFVLTGKTLLEFAIPNKKQIILQQIQSIVEQTHGKLKENSAALLTDPNPYIRFYMQQLMKGVI
jgi:hypothetical protein